MRRNDTREEEEEEEEGILRRLHFVCVCVCVLVYSYHLVRATLLSGALSPLHDIIRPGVLCFNYY